VEKDRFGLTPEERDRLAGDASAEPEMDFKTSMLAFACLLLICIMILVASFIARSQAGKSESGVRLRPAHAPTEAAPPSNENKQEIAQEERNTGTIVPPDALEPDTPTEPGQNTSDALPSPKKDE